MQKHSLVYFTLLAYLLSWLVWLPLYLPYFGISVLPVLPYHHALEAIGPIAAAFIVTYHFHGKEATKELASRVVKWNVPVKWHILV